MKKILTLTLTLAMIISMAACSKDKKELEAYDYYLQVSEKMNSAKSLEMNLDAKVKIEVEGETIDMLMSGTTKQVMNSETDMEMEMDLEINMMGQAMSTKSYFKDGYMYMDSFGMKIKTPMDMEEAAAQANIMEDVKFAKEAVKDSKVEKTDDAVNVTFTIDGKVMQDMVETMMQSMLGSLGGEEAKIEIGDMTISYVISGDGVPKNMKIIYPMSLEVEGETMKMDYDMDMEIVSVDSIEKIDFPADLDSYQEVPAM